MATLNIPLIDWSKYYKAFVNANEDLVLLPRYESMSKKIISIGETFRAAMALEFAQKSIALAKEI